MKGKVHVWWKTCRFVINVTCKFPKYVLTLVTVPCTARRVRCAFLSAMPMGTTGILGLYRKALAASTICEGRSCCGMLKCDLEIYSIQVFIVYYYFLIHIHVDENNRIVRILSNVKGTFYLYRNIFTFPRLF